MVTAHVVGLAFEHWTFDVLRPYIMKLGATRCNGNPDFYFNKNEHVVLLECKCYRYRTTQGKDTTKPAYLSLRKSQIDSLRKMKVGFGGENETYLVVGITFGQYDVIPMVVELEDALKHAKRWSDRQNRKWVSMEWIIKQQSLRLWMSEMFGIEPEHIQFPEFRSYLR